MRLRSLIVALFAALLTLAGQAPAQQQKPSAQTEAVPDAPQPQKKKAEKPAPLPDAPAEGSVDSSTAPAPEAKPPAGKNDNAFPEAVSRDAAARAAQEDKDSSPDPASSSPAPDGAKRPASEGNPFPEDVSKDAARDAAKAADKDAATETVPRSSLPPGVSSSQSSSSSGGDDQGVPFSDPARSKKDTEIGTFYLKTGNVQGALLRFKTASAADPTNVAAIFGLAESQRMLGNAAEAARNYQLYLDIVPNGPKAKDSMKALKTLQAQK